MRLSRIKPFKVVVREKYSRFLTLPSHLGVTKGKRPVLCLHTFKVMHLYADLDFCITFVQEFDIPSKYIDVDDGRNFLRFKGLERVNGDKVPTILVDLNNQRGVRQ